MAKIKGICKNYDADCSLCNSKVVQEAERDNFICEECHLALTEVSDSPSKKRNIKPVLIAVVLAIIAAMGLCLYWLFSDNEIEVTGLKPVKTEYTLNPGDSTKVSIDVIPAEATDKSLIWSSQNPQVAVVADGVVKAIAEGKAVVTAKTKVGNAETSVNVTVVAKVSEANIESNPIGNTPLVTAIKVIPETCSVKVGESMTLSTVIVPNEAADTNLIWKSSNTNVVEVSNGIVKGVSKGAANVYVMSNDGQAKTIIPVTVTDRKSGGNNSNGGNKKSTAAPGKVRNNSRAVAIGSGATFIGTTKNGCPHGQGRLVFKYSQRIDAHDSKNRTANKGDYIIGEWYNGHLVFGTLYSSNGTVLSSINLGRPSSTDISDPYYQADKSLYR